MFSFLFSLVLVSLVSCLSLSLFVSPCLSLSLLVSLSCLSLLSLSDLGSWLLAPGSWLFSLCSLFFPLSSSLSHVMWFKPFVHEDVKVWCLAPQQWLVRWERPLRGQGETAFYGNGRHRPEHDIKRPVPVCCGFFRITRPTRFHLGSHAEGCARLSLLDPEIQRLLTQLCPVLERTMEPIVCVPVPQILEEIVEVRVLDECSSGPSSNRGFVDGDSPHHSLHSLECVVDQIINMPVPQIWEKECLGGVVDECNSASSIHCGCAHSMIEGGVFTPDLLCGTPKTGKVTLDGQYDSSLASMTPTTGNTRQLLHMLNDWFSSGEPMTEMQNKHMSYKK